MWDRIDNAFRTSAAGRWFGTLETNERSMVALLGAFIAVLLLYGVVWRPLHDWSSSADAKYQRQLAVLDWMRVHESEARAAGQRVNGSPEAGSLLTLVANSAARAGLSLLRYQKEGDGVAVVLENQPFNSLIGWIAALERDDNVTVKQISIDGQSAPGLVNARITLI
ncbi:MAG TPA: type II secretion system protein M [Pseudomonadales bacterium]